MTTLRCIACGSEMSLDACLAHEELRLVAWEILKLCVPTGALLMRYVSLFRPPKNKMSATRTAQLVKSLLPNIQNQIIEHNGRQWDVPEEVWRTGIEVMLAKADAGKLTLPLTSHNYLFTILADLAAKIEAEQERATEEQRRHPVRSVGNTTNAQPKTATQALDPELQKIINRKADPIPESVKALSQKLKEER